MMKPVFAYHDDEICISNFDLSNGWWYAFLLRHALWDSSRACSTANAKALQFGMTHIITNLFLKMSSRAVGNGEAMTRRRGIPYSQRTTLKIQPISVGEGFALP